MKRMKTAVIVVFAAAGLLAGGCSKKKGGGVKLRSDVDSVAYVIGMNGGLNLQRMDSTLNVAAVCEGSRAVFAGKTDLTMEEAETFYLAYVNYALPEKARAYEEQFLADFAKSNRSYARTSSGVTYAVEDVGDQNQIPTSERDSVVMRVVIRSVDGKELYSSYERGDSLRMALSEMTRGLKESVKLIGRGGRINAWMPSSAAYGADGSEEFGVGPNATLCYDIELIAVDKYANRTRRGNLR